MSKISLAEFTMLVDLMLATHPWAELCKMFMGRHVVLTLDDYVVWGAMRKTTQPRNAQAFLQVYNLYSKGD